VVGRNKVQITLRKIRLKSKDLVFVTIKRQVVSTFFSELTQMSPNLCRRFRRVGQKLVTFSILYECGLL